MNDVTTVKLATRREIADKLDRLAVSADVKLLMTQLAALTMKVGDAIVDVGRRIMSFAFETVKLFPHITLGVIVGFTMW